MSLLNLIVKVKRRSIGELLLDWVFPRQGHVSLFRTEPSKPLRHSESLANLIGVPPKGLELALRLLLDLFLL